jgi:hypothetical protein
MAGCHCESAAADSSIGSGGHHSEGPSCPGRLHSHTNFEAVLHKAAVGIWTLTVGRSKTRRTSFCCLDSVDKFRLFPLSRYYAKGLGLFSHFGHCHTFISDFDCIHISLAVCHHGRGSTMGGTDCQFPQPVRHFCSLYFGCFHAVRYECFMMCLPNQNQAQICIPRVIFSDEKLFWQGPRKKRDSTLYIGPLLTSSACPNNEYRTGNFKLRRSLFVTQYSVRLWAQTVRISRPFQPLITMSNLLDKAD